MSTIFKVHGPFNITRTAKRGGKLITSEDGKAFWMEHSELLEKTGCYIFVRRAGKGYKPGYVGKATKTFKQEVFTKRNLSLYNEFLLEYRAGTPMLFLLESPSRRNARHDSHIRDLEDFLIQTAVRLNPELMNIRGTAKEQWGIGGVLRSGSGGHSQAASEFRQALKLFR